MSGDIPQPGEIVTGVDDANETRIGMVVDAEAGLITIEDFGDRYVLRDVGMVTDLVSEDDEDADDHLDVIESKFQELGVRPSFSLLWDAIVEVSAAGGVTPATSTTTYINAAVVEQMVQNQIEDIPEAGAA